MNALNGKKFLLFGFILVLLVAIPLTVLTLQKSQETRSRATPATTLSFSPATVATRVGDTFTLDIVITPGSNQISFAKFIVTYDPVKLATASPGIALIIPTGLQDQGFTSIIEGPTFTPGMITLTASIGTDIQRAIQTTSTQSSTKVATLTFKALAETIGGVATQVVFAPPPQSQLLSVNKTSDTASENVLLPNNSPAQVTIAQGLAQPTLPPQASPTATPGPTSALGQNKPPVCTNLNVDRTTSGAAPFSITFTANGNDPDNTIKKVTFDFGDGPVQDVTQNGGVGSNSVSVQIAHTYNNSGTYKAKAILTDASNAVSADVAACQQTITVTQTPGTTPGATPSATATGTITATPTLTPTSVPQPTLSKPGPGDKLVGIGAIGAVITIIGALLFLAL